MRSRAYGSVSVNQVDVSRLSQSRVGQDVDVGVDIGKYCLMVVCRWRDGSFERPWRVSNPMEIGRAVELLKSLGVGRRLVVGLEPSGTYGDALRQSLHDAGIGVQRISPKAAHDYAEVFDGVPSQHDGKDAAVVAELTALGKGKTWVYDGGDAWEQELTYWVERLVWHQRQQTLGLCSIEALLGRHWPEATGSLRTSSGTLLRVLMRYGGPKGLAADEEGRSRLQRWGGVRLSAEKVEKLLSDAKGSVGVRQGEWETRRLREMAEQTYAARREVSRCKRRLEQMTAGHAVLEAQGSAVGKVTACVLWNCTGDPREYHCAEAYRKAMGLNLVERSSGIHQGALKISKRGQARSRQWLYMASLRLVQQAGVKSWYEGKKSRDAEAAKRALVAVMRKLALALYQVGVTGSRFEACRLFAGVERKAGAPRAKASPRVEAGLGMGK